MFSRRFAVAARSPAFASKAFSSKAAFSPASPFPQVTPSNEALSLPQVIPTRKSPVYLYADGDVDPNAVDQLVRLAESEITVGHVAGMPDVHLGLGVAIGGVFASDKYVCPNAVGVDIGCGMCAVPFEGLYKDDLSPESLKKIHTLLRERIPTAFDSHASQLSGTSVVLDEIAQEFPPAGFVKDKAFVEGKLRSRTLKQLGTLGGGNHFIEISYDETRQIWAMLHSGSRHIGNATAARYDDVAKEIMQKKGLRASPGLHYLEIDSAEGQCYLSDMLFCQRYAWQNRKHMRDIMVNVVNEVTKSSPDESRSVNVHHNFCVCERCSYVDPVTGERVEKDLWVTRKGATSAQAGQLGAIPGSMATGSYITRGKGNTDAWSSSSHGAGRRMSRTKALKQIQQRDFEHAMEGVVWDAHPSLRDEAPQAYKDLNAVMQNQESMVEIVHHLTPIVNVKGLSGKDAYRKNKRQRQWKPKRQQRWG